LLAALVFVVARHSAQKPIVNVELQGIQQPAPANSASAPKTVAPASRELHPEAGAVSAAAPANFQKRVVKLEPQASQRLAAATGAPAVPERPLENLAVRQPRVWINPTDGLPYVFIPPPVLGEFKMGCSPGDNECFDDETFQTEVISNGFWLGQTVVTQAAWKKVMNSNPSHFKGDQLPVEQVDWNQAGGYCKAIGGRLPTEKEWEYAARAGTTSARYGPLDSVAWYSRNSGGTTHPVGLKQVNAFGLYDMLGNVREWTADNYNATGPTQVLRGASWDDDARYVRASDLSRFRPTERGNVIGFRCVAELR
jgi:formylglycine-generating enzyme required for sulfatase activity